MPQLIIKPRAIQMAQEAYDWYEEQQQGLGELFLKELQRCFDKIEDWPLLYAKIKKDFRQIVLHTFPYVIVFEIMEGDVIVYAVFHTSRSPRKKFRR
ncbi:type II toxin-antitoxin system RelE/ParE family toxin [Mucilaginibacter psychrotolerans]|uniref:Type II toxin-antitoxin system RelE/ParE family toxin n=1 Tax=Mucilaginibacter psychrotolerans TaxID=1524096 RepID=A0A4Y8SR59_9SPHI|nr:type II toxin-antitoxin system RelE/ParE family toxin [Mucilaginibacter psychrotolerans]TFF40836.1 type II toxin-antitoxin system RelE/ParE family toxin [Mucilaginibacter psychrotolerans]